MAVPRDPVARRYYRAAVQRLDDARVVLAVTERTTAAVYLAGYCVECVLKALVLAQTPVARRPAVQQELFTHSYRDLLVMYTTRGGPTIPRDVQADLSAVDTWQPRLRYDPGTIPGPEAARFLAAVTRIHDWAAERLAS